MNSGSDAGTLFLVAALVTESSVYSWKDPLLGPLYPAVGAGLRKSWAVCRKNLLHKPSGLLSELLAFVCFENTIGKLQNQGRSPAVSGSPQLVEN